MTNTVIYTLILLHKITTFAIKITFSEKPLPMIHFITTAYLLIFTANGFSFVHILSLILLFNVPETRAKHKSELNEKGN